MAAVIKAVLDRDHQKLEFLLSQNPDVNFRDGEHNSALYYAAAYSEVRMISALLDAGFDPLFRNSHGNTALGAAAMNGASGAIRELLSRAPALLEVCNQWDETPIHLAAALGCPRTLEELMRAPGACEVAERCDHWKRSALVVLRQHGHQAHAAVITRVLPAHLAGSGGGPAEAAAERSAAALPALTVALSKKLELPLDREFFIALLGSCLTPEVVNGRDYFGLAAVHKLAAWGEADCLAALLDHPHFDRGSLDTPGGDSRQTPIEVAESFGALASAQVILDFIARARPGRRPGARPEGNAEAAGGSLPEGGQEAAGDGQTVGEEAPGNDPPGEENSGERAEPAERKKGG